MKKSDLKTGMRIVARNGDEFIVLKNVTTPRNEIEDMYVSIKGGWMGSCSYNEDLIAKSNSKEWDIMKVYAQNKGEYLDGQVLKEKTSNFDLMWERDNKKEMTISEIEKELGYSIKIIKEN